MIDALAGDIGHPDDVVSLTLTKYELGLLCALWVCGHSLVEVMCAEGEAKVEQATRALEGQTKLLCVFDPVSCEAVRDKIYAAMLAPEVSA